jgi:hypothetical protein
LTNQATTSVAAFDKKQLDTLAVEDLQVLLLQQQQPPWQKTKVGVLSSRTEV